MRIFTPKFHWLVVGLQNCIAFPRQPKLLPINEILNWSKILFANIEPGGGRFDDFVFLAIQFRDFIVKRVCFLIFSASSPLLIVIDAD